MSSRTITHTSSLYHCPPTTPMSHSPLNPIYPHPPNPHSRPTKPFPSTQITSPSNNRRKTHNPPTMPDPTPQSKPKPPRQPRFIEQMDFSLANSTLHTPLGKKVVKPKVFDDFVPAEKLSTWGEEDGKKKKKGLGGLVRSFRGDKQMIEMEKGRVLSYVGEFRWYCWRRLF
jgi:hypothetical protein